jgi:very-short-patch-repair endonuclease
MSKLRKQKNCERCNVIHDRRRSKYCSAHCANIVSTKTKEKISKARIKYLKENPDKHVWKRNTKFKSEPCEKVKKFLNEQRILFVEEWNPLDSRLFSIDIAFPDIKLGIEINGNQHYNKDGTLKEYYQNRHNEIVAAGWKLIELHYSSCFNEEILKNLITRWEQPDYAEFFNVKALRTQKKLINKPEARGTKAKRKTDEKFLPKIKKLLESDINFSVFGWVKKASVILEVPEQKVNKYMKRYALEFYTNNCFKRKSNHV